MGELGVVIHMYNNHDVWQCTSMKPDISAHPITLKRAKVYCLRGASSREGVGRVERRAPLLAPLVHLISVPARGMQFT